LVSRFDDRRRASARAAADHGAVAECPGEYETEHRDRHNQFGSAHAHSFSLMLVFVSARLIVRVISSLAVMLVKLGRWFGTILIDL
jgi:hypothetical protein